MASGKAHGRNSVVLFGGYDVSGDISSAEYDKATATAKSTGMGGTTDETYVIGPSDNKASFKGFFDDTAAAGLYTAMNALEGTFFVASLLPAGDAQGDASIGLRSLTNSDIKTTSPVGGVVTMDVNAQHSGGVDFGLVVQPRTTQTGTGSAQNQATALDNAASTSNGGEAYFHITAVGAGTVSPLKLQHSADNVTFVDLVSSGLAGTAIGADHQTVAAGTTVNRYLRVSETCTNAVSYATCACFKRS